jgi:hypothetical protein
MYTTDSSIIGYQPIASGWRAALTAHGAVPDADTILAAYDASCRALHLDPNLALSQACHEATYFTSTRWTQENNPAGLGVTSNNTPPNPFKTPQEGIQAHCEHLCCYCYTIAACPCDHAHLSDRRHFFHDGMPRIADLERLPARGWANPGIGYVESIVSIANSIVGSNPQPPPGGTVRIIVSAGHEGIQNITSDPNGTINPATLRGGTGANGEMAWNAACADALTGLLTAAGVDAVRTDAIYHADVYGPDADLAYVIHYDGGAGTGRAQYCMASTVHSGPSTTAVDALADAFVADWYAMYPAAMGIAGNGPITTDMLQLYNGWYRSASTPMVIGEHCLGADANGIRSDRPTPQAAADAVFAVMAKHFNLTNNPQPPVPPPASTTIVDGFDIGEGFAQLYRSVSEDAAARLRIFGLVKAPGQYDGFLVYPANDAQKAKGLNEVVHPVVICDWERVPMIWDKGRTADPWSVRIPGQLEYIGVADDVVIDAIIESMTIANEPI